MTEILTREQILELLQKRFPGEEQRILAAIGLQALILRNDLATDGGSIVGVDPPAGYTSDTLNAILDELAAAIAALGTPPASDVTFDDSATIVASGADVQAAIESLDEAKVPVLSTGIVYGGVGSVVGGIGVGTTVDITAGVAIFIDNTTPSAPTYTRRAFGPFSGLSLANTSVPLTWWYIDSDGSIQQQTTEPTPTQYRTRVFLFRTGFTGGAITSLVPIVNPLNNTAANLGDLARAIGIVIEDGCRVRPNGANLQLNRQSGTLLYWGGGYAINFDDPHEVPISSATPLTFRMIQSTGNPGAFITSLPVTQYESAPGTLTNVPGATTRCTIITAFGLPSGNYLFQYDNTFYTTIAEARVALSTGSRTFTPNPLVAQADGICVGFIIVQTGATALNNAAQALFLDTNKFGELGGGAASAETARWGGIIGNIADQADIPPYLNTLYGQLAAANSWAGIQTFTSDNTNLQAAAPRINWIESDAAADSGRWRMQANASVFELFAYNDAGSVFSPVFQVSRTGTTVTNFNVRASDLQINGVPVARGATTVGNNILTAANPSAIRFIRINADNTVSLLSAADQLAALGGVGPGIPLNVQNATYTFALADNNRAVIKNNTTAYTWTIPLESTVAFPDGAAITIINDSGTGAVTISPTGGVTLVAGGTTGSFTLAVNESRTLHKVGTNRWRVL